MSMSSLQLSNIARFSISLARDLAGALGPSSAAASSLCFVLQGATVLAIDNGISSVEQFGGTGLRPTTKASPPSYQEQT